MPVSRIIDLVCFAGLCVLPSTGALHVSSLFPELQLLQSQKRPSVLRAARRFPEARWSRIVAFFASGLVSMPILAVLPIPPMATLLITLTLVSLSAEYADVFLFRSRIAERIRAEMNARGHVLCLNCGYDVQGAASPYCSECGAKIAFRLCGADTPLSPATQRRPLSQPWRFRLMLCACGVALTTTLLGFVLNLPGGSTNPVSGAALVFTLVAATYKGRPSCPVCRVRMTYVEKSDPWEYDCPQCLTRWVGRGSEKH